MFRLVLPFAALATACAPPSADPQLPTESDDDASLYSPSTGEFDDDADMDADSGDPDADTRDAEGLATSPMGHARPEREEPEQGSMQMTMHDAPIDLDAMPVTIGRVEARDVGGLLPEWHTLSDEAISFDLLSLQNGREVTLFDGDLDATRYDRLRITLDEVGVEVGGVEIDLKLPLAAGVPVDADFAIEPDRHYLMVLDFDAYDSVTRTPLGIVLTPDITVESFEEVDRQ